MSIETNVRGHFSEFHSSYEIISIYLFVPFFLLEMEKDIKFLKKSIANIFP